MAVESSSPSSQPKPTSPPPPYTEVADSASHAQSSTVGTPFGGPPPSSPFPVHASYGPTPIQQQTQLLPYYDPRSPYAIAEANSRARWRFLVALLWAIAFLGLMSFLTGYEVSLSMYGAHHGGWMSGSDRAEW